MLKENISFEEYIDENNIHLFYKRLPKFKRGLIFQYRDINIIYISSHLSEKSKNETLLHEFAHFELNHMEKSKQYIAFSIYEAEDEADDYIKKIIDSIK